MRTLVYVFQRHAHRQNVVEMLTEVSISLILLPFACILYSSDSLMDCHVGNLITKQLCLTDGFTNSKKLCGSSQNCATDYSLSHRHDDESLLQL